MILQPVFSIFPCSPLPSGTCRTPGLSIPWCCLPTSSFVRLEDNAEGSTCCARTLMKFHCFNHTFLHFLVQQSASACSVIIENFISWQLNFVENPRREAGDVWCLPPVWKFRAVIWFHFAISTLVLLPSPVTLSVLSFSACWPFLLNFFQKILQYFSWRDRLFCMAPV